MNKSKYIVGALLFDEEEQLFYRKVGLDDNKKTLIYTVWGKTEQEVDENVGAIFIQKRH